MLRHADTDTFSMCIVHSALHIPLLHWVPLIFNSGNKSQRGCTAFPGPYSFPRTAQLGLDIQLLTWYPLCPLQLEHYTQQKEHYTQQMEQVTGQETKLSLALPYLKIENDFLLIFIIFHFHASLNCLGLARPRCSSVKLSEKGNLKKFPAAFQQNEFLLPLSFFPRWNRK